MNTNVLEVVDVVKSYKNFHAVDHINLQIEKGSIFGLIGENGAGKSTLMKMISGLAMKSQGEIRLFGKNPQSDPYVYRRIGTLIENSGLYPALNAYDNLKLKSLSMGCYQEKKIYELLDLCDLRKAGKKKTKHFSMGMKQRLGIAMALLGDPEFLILDEPTNGLDPQGIREIRELLLKLNKERGMTILISSHILEELGKVATNYGIIKNGKMVECISKDDFLEKCKDCLKLQVSDTNRAVACLEETCQIHDYEVLPEQILYLYDGYDHPEQIARTLILHDIDIYQMNYHKQSLESYFLKKSGDEDVK